jgi:hypothetical protein
LEALTDSRAARFVALAVASIALMAALSAPRASAAGGATIASAPIVPFGVHEFGTTATGEYDCGPGEFWDVVLQPSDQITIDWETAKEAYAYEVVVYPAGTTDFSINNVEPLERYFLGNNGKAEAVFSSGTGGTFPIVFAASGCNEDNNAGPYDFTVNRQRAILVNLAPHQNVNTNTTLGATATFANGAPVPDGLSFTLEASWGDGSTLYGATSSGGALSFPLALPESAIGDTASFVVTRPGDSQYQAVKSGILESRVAKPYVPPPPPPSACELARERAHVLAHQYRRLLAHYQRARGQARRRLAHRAARAGRRFRAARAHAGSLCG